MIIKLLYFYLLFAFANADTSTYTSGVAGCEMPTARMQPGFSANIYTYNTESTVQLESTYFINKYATLDVKHSNVYVGSISLFGSFSTTMTSWGMTFGSNGIIVEVITYVHTGETGFYTFENYNADDGLMMFIGVDAFACGNVEALGDSFNYILYQQKPSGANTGYGDTAVYLQGDSYYPFRIVYYNYGLAYRLNVHLYGPDGSELEQQSVLFNDDNNGDQTDCTAVYNPTHFATGCSISATKLQQGFNVNVYNYDATATPVLPASVYSSDYTSLSIVASNTAVVSDLALSAVSVSSMATWGMSFSTSGIIVEILSYLYVGSSGVYQFVNSEIEDGVMVFLGTDAFSCCDSSDFGSPEEYILFAQKPSGGSETVSANIYLTGTGYYPLRIV
ncbi:unnamed protein product [[Candida] boidinii]|nr:unnamed protein product [[Candida] boidinii]